MTTTDFSRQHVRQERWRHHSAKEREALADLALGIKRYLAQLGPGNINNAAFIDAAMPHLEKMKQVIATAKPRRLSQLHRTLQLTAQASDPKEKTFWELYAMFAFAQRFNGLVAYTPLSCSDRVLRFVLLRQRFVHRCHGRKMPQPFDGRGKLAERLEVEFGPFRPACIA